MASKKEKKSKKKIKKAVKARTFSRLAKRTPAKKPKAVRKARRPLLAIFKLGRPLVKKTEPKLEPAKIVEIQEEIFVMPEAIPEAVPKQAQPEIVEVAPVYEEALPNIQAGDIQLAVQEEDVDLEISLGRHAQSGHELDLRSAFPEDVQSEAVDDLSEFFGEVVPPAKRLGWFGTIKAILYGIFADERVYRVMSPGRPRLLDELADELLLINFAQLVFNIARWIFVGYFSALYFFANNFWRLLRGSERPAAVMQSKEVRIARMKELIKETPYKTFQPELVAWKANFGLFHFAPPLRFERALATFVLLAFVFVIPLRIVSTYKEMQDTKSIFMERSVKAFETLNGSWSQEGNLEGAAAAFETASKSFDQILADVEETHKLLQSIAGVLPEGEQLEAGKALLQAGSQVSAAAEVLTARLVTLDDSFIPPADRVHQLGESLQTALPLLSSASENLNKISIDIIPAEFRASAASAMELLDSVVQGVQSSETAANVLEDILGRFTPRRFLVVFQNNSEIRPTGGFMGSFAEIDTDDGDVKKLWMPGAGSYELQGSLRASLVPPAPLQLITDHWQFHDSNWFPDFPTSAKKIMWFYEKSGGPTVDGVIALTTSVVEKILEATGPIEMPEYGKTITADNFWIETQKAVELEYDKGENKPKQFLADMAPKLLEKLQSKDPKMFFRLAGALHEAIGEKHFQVYLRDPAMQEKVVHLGWAGALKKTSGDFLAVINTNIAGGKTDTIVGEHIKHEAKISEDGHVVVEVEVTRTHHGTKGELFSGTRNVDYVRLYVPEGSHLLKAEGFKKPDSSYFKSVAPDAVPDVNLAAEDATEIDEPVSGTRITKESGYTVFGNWIMVDPGGSVTYKVSYELPFQVGFKTEPEGFFEKIGLRDVPPPQAAYSFLLVKQAGTVNTTFEHAVEIPEKWKEIWKYPKFISIPGKLDKDLFFGQVMSAASVGQVQEQLN